MKNKHIIAAQDLRRKTADFMNTPAMIELCEKVGLKFDAATDTETGETIGKSDLDELFAIEKKEFKELKQVLHKNENIPLDENYVSSYLRRKQVEKYFEQIPKKKKTKVNASHVINEDENLFLNKQLKPETMPKPKGYKNKIEREEQIPIWDFDANKELECVFLDEKKMLSLTQGEKEFFIVDVNGERYLLPNNVDLTNRVKSLSAGTEIFIELTGKTKTPKGTMKTFEVYTK